MRNRIGPRREQLLHAPNSELHRGDVRRFRNRSCTNHVAMKAHTAIWARGFESCIVVEDQQYDLDKGFGGGFKVKWCPKLQSDIPTASNPRRCMPKCRLGAVQPQKMPSA